MRLKSNFPYLNADSLEAFSLLGCPLYIYSFETQRICWANRPAMGFWDTTSEEELLNRLLTPYSDSTRIRLDDYREAFGRGEIRHESWTFYPHGKATAAMCRCSGVSLDGHDQAMLVEIEARLDTELPFADLRSLEALRHTRLMISLFTEEGSLLTQNPAATRTFGHLAGSAGNESDCFRAMFADPDAIVSLLAEGREQSGIKTTAVMALPDAPIHSLDISYVSDPVTARRSILVTQEDISPLIGMSRQLAASEYALDAVLNLNLAPSLVLSVGECRVVKANHSAQQLLGEAIRGDDGCEAVFETPDDFARLKGMILASGTGALPTRLRVQDGRHLWFHIVGARIRYERDDAVVLLMTDVDDVYRSTADLEAALSSERRISDIQRRFLAIASHEFRTPLAIIDSAAQRLERRADEKTPEQIRSRASRIRGSIKSLLHLLDSTIERVRLDQIELGYRPEPACLAQAVDHVVQSFRERDAETIFEIEGGELPVIAFDRPLIERVLSNIITNAIKYSDAPARIRIDLRALEQTVQIEVRDHGIGIPESERDRVFEAYARASNVGPVEGSGLGLAIVNQIIDLHGGSVAIVDTQGEGTTIRITLPRL